MVAAAGEGLPLSSGGEARAPAERPVRPRVAPVKEALSPLVDGSQTCPRRKPSRRSVLCGMSCSTAVFKEHGRCYSRAAASLRFSWPLQGCGLGRDGQDRTVSGWSRGSQGESPALTSDRGNTAMASSPCHHPRFALRVILPHSRRWCLWCRRAAVCLPRRRLSSRISLRLCGPERSLGAGSALRSHAGFYAASPFL